MNNTDRQYYKKESELPLSKRLAQEFICSPLLRRNGLPAKGTTRFPKNPDVNFLFDDEKPKVKTRRTEKLRRVIDLSDAIRKQIVRIDEKKLSSGDRALEILTKRAPRWTKKQTPMTMSYFVEVDSKSPSIASTKVSAGSVPDNSKIPEGKPVSTLDNLGIPKVSTKGQDGTTKIPEASVVSNMSYSKSPEARILNNIVNPKIKPGSAIIPEASVLSRIDESEIKTGSTKLPETSIVSRTDESKIKAGSKKFPETSIVSRIDESKIKAGSIKLTEAGIVSRMGESKNQAGSTKLTGGSNVGNMSIPKIQAGNARIPEGSIVSNMGIPKIQADNARISEGSIVSNMGIPKIQTGSARIPEGSIVSNMGIPKIQAGNARIQEGSIVSNMGIPKIQAGSARIPEGSIVSNMGIPKIQAGSARTPEGSIVSNIGIPKIQASVARIPEGSFVSNMSISTIQSGFTRIPEGSIVSNMGISKTQAGSTKIAEANIESTSVNPRIPDGSIVSSPGSSISQGSSAATVSHTVIMEDEDQSEITSVVSSKKSHRSSSFVKLKKKMSSHLRLKGTELNHLHAEESERKSSKESVGSLRMDMSSILKTLSKLGVPLRRQLSEIDLNLLGENASDPFMVRSILESYLDLPNLPKKNVCVYPGWELGQHGHSVAATVLNKGFPEPCLSSSSSSDDLFESTKYSRDIIEEKLRGLAFEKKQEEDRSKDVENKNEKGKVKSKRKSNCHCGDKKGHRKCSGRTLTKADCKFSVTTTSKDSATSRDDLGSEFGGTEPSSALSFLNKVDESEAGSLFQTPQNSKDKSKGSIGKLVGSPSDKSSSSEEILKRPCNRDTCPMLNKSLPGEVDVTESQNLRRPSNEKTKLEKPKDVEKLKSDHLVLGEPTQSNVRLKNEESVSSVRPEFCTQETCEFARNQMQKQNADLFKQFKTSKSEHSYYTVKRKEICSPNTCKLSGRRYKKLFSKARKLKCRTRNRRWKRKYHDFVCDCQNVYVGNNDSDTDDLWSDKGLKRSRTRRYCMTLEHLNNTAIKKCGGFMTEGQGCNCYSCYIKEKPWKEFLKKPNVVLDVPYPLTTKVLKLRAQNTNSLLKKLRNKYNWSEENLKNFCTRHEVCKKPNLRKSLLQENPYTWDWRWCNKNNLEKKVKKKDVPKEDNKGRFGYYVKIKEERLTRGEHFTNIQKIIEKAVFCKWNIDAAEMKLNHFLENMPSQQTCYAQGKTFDSDRRTCYNPKLINRLVDMVNFNDEPDRKIHEFSFPPKLLKYQEPQLVGDIATDMPEIRPVMELAKFPTIYRDLFKNQKRDLRKMMDTILPPLQWTDKAGLWEMKVSIEPDNEETNIGMIKYLDFNETLCHAINKNFCAGRYRLYLEVFAEVIRQELIVSPERAFLLSRIREEFLLTLLLYDGGLEMTLVAATHLWKDIEAETIDIIEKETLEKEIEEIQGQIKGIVAATYDLEKLAEEQSQTRDYLSKDQQKLYKKTNHQLAAQVSSY